jgi:ABC-type lipopolysaccharide export system ATPase subunit
MRDYFLQRINTGPLSIFQLTINNLQVSQGMLKSSKTLSPTSSSTKIANNLLVVHHIRTALEDNNHSLTKEFREHQIDPLLEEHNLSHIHKVMLPREVKASTRYS